MKIGIVGYGNLGRAIDELAQRRGVEIYGIFSRRSKDELAGACAEVYPFSEIWEHSERVDLLINAGGSKSDLGKTTPALARVFDVVDSYDLHAELAEHIKSCDAAARASGRIAIVGGGWDPGLFSVLRMYMSAIHGIDPVTFWGRGVSQGHSQAIRTIEGVRQAIEYTIPRTEAVVAAERGEEAGGDHQRTKRVCYVVAEASEHRRIEREIKDMPDYFSGYETEVEFISESEFRKKHNRLYHRGRVISTSREIGSKLDFTASLDSNPHFTAAVLLALAGAADTMKKRGYIGAYTMADIPPSAFAPDNFMRFL